MPGLFDGTSLHRPVTCEHCGRPLPESAASPADACACPRDAAGEVKLPRHQHPRVRREKRRGNWCTIVADLDPQATDLKALLKSLRTDLGAGGGLAGQPGSPELLIQGDHRDVVVARLRELGYHAKAAGG